MYTYLTSCKAAGVGQGFKHLPYDLSFNRCRLTYLVSGKEAGVGGCERALVTVKNYPGVLRDLVYPDQHSFD